MKKNSYFIVVFLSVCPLLFAVQGLLSQNWIWNGEGPGVGSNGDVKYFYYDSVDDVTYMAGRFKFFDGIQVNGTCKYDGINIYPVGGGYDDCGNIGCYNGGEAIIRYKSKLYVGHTYFSIGGGVPANGIATWDGTQWHPVGEGVKFFDGDNGYVTRMAIYDDELYAFGYFDLAGSDTSYNMARWDGDYWHRVEHPYKYYDGAVPFFSDAIAFEGKLYVTGSFALSNSFGDQVDVARYDGETWETVGGGIKGGLDDGYGFAIYKGELYLRGTFRKTAGNAANKIMKLQNDQWVDVGGSLPHPGYKILGMVVFKDKLYISGLFYKVGDGVPAHNIAVWDGAKWCGLGTVFDSSSINGPLGYFHDELLLAGGFSVIDGDSIHRFAKWIGGDYVDTCGMPVATLPQPQKQTTLTLSPNPAHSTIHITAQLPAVYAGAVTLSAYNVLGQFLWQQTLPAANGEIQTSVDVSAWPPGVYFISIEAGGQTWVEKVVVR